MLLGESLADMTRERERGDGPGDCPGLDEAGHDDPGSLTASKDQRWIGLSRPG
jgi:hypothetical protein